MTDDAGIFRNKLTTEGNFTTVSNTWIRGSGLSPQSNFLWIYLLSHKVGYELRDSQILHETGFGPKGLRAARKELVEAGWLRLQRKKNQDGSLGTYAYHLQEPRVPQGTVETSTVEQGTVPDGSDLRRPLEEKTIVKKTRKKRELTPLPDDFEPNPSVYDDPRWLTVDVDREVERFRNWALANDKEFKDWQAALRNWLDRSIDYQRGRVYKETERDAEKRRLDEWLASQMEDEE